MCLLGLEICNTMYSSCAWKVGPERCNHAMNLSGWSCGIDVIISLHAGSCLGCCRYQMSCQCLGKPLKVGREKRGGPLDCATSLILRLGGGPLPERFTFWRFGDPVGGVQAVRFPQPEGTVPNL
jgi:hypothetical protein